MALYKALKNIDKKTTQPRLAVVKKTCLAKVSKSTPESVSAEESKALWEFLMKMTPLPIAITCLSDGRLVMVNQRWAKLTGCSPAEAIGRTAEELGLCNPPDKPNHLFNALVDALDPNGEVQDFQSCVYRDGRQPLYCAIWAKKIRYMGRDCLLTITSYATSQSEARQNLQSSAVIF